jgi:hypothetical protein
LPERAPLSKAEGVDLDFSVLSGTMLTAEYNKLIANPEDYIGKIIKASGFYSASYSRANDRYSHYVIMKNQEGCCVELFEFVWSGDRVYPDDYPPENALIEVTGVFTGSSDFSNIHYYLAVDDVTVVR